ncbi:MAG: VWA domain-containing protein, partial [Kiritimatiellae bacterium]|nr:VWA domain-containing protein [Kiritimatiellia bacterium]
PAPPPRGAAGDGTDELLAPPVAAMPAEIEAGPAARGDQAAQYVVETPEEVRPAVPLDDVLAPRISVHRPRRDDGYVYFRIDVVRKGEDVLPPIPRDVLLVQDASRSLAPQRLAACRKAMRDALAALPPGDRFNVLVFNTENRFFRPGGWAPATPENVAAAGAFLDGVSAEGNTDIFNAMKGALSLPRDPGRSAVAMLLSDGVTTAGDFRRDSQIIGEFSKLNDGALSVFDVGVSKNSDEYLLSMLSFCNRGGPAAIARDRFEIDDAFEGTFKTLGSPVLDGVRFLFDSSSKAVVVPERTENLYLDRPLRLYGRAPLGTESVSFQARGANAGKGYDMVYELPLGDPAPGAGDREMARTWARTRIYDLVAAYVRAPDPALLAEMAALGRAHDVKIPFDGRFLRQ